MVYLPTCGLIFVIVNVGKTISYMDPMSICSSKVVQIDQYQPLGSEVGAAMDCGRPINKAPVIFPSKLLQDFGSKENMFSGHLEEKPSDKGKSSSLL